ncbi:hypothetical protein [Bdellovibrio sp. BCCA]|uniref:hypothetical protein n=1 Tax=Bdellovibrio sp. BCCA TaxID=3136281 RepID=UPI0030F27AD4
MSDAAIQEAFRQRFNINVNIEELIFSRSSLEEILASQNLYSETGTVTKQGDQAIEIIGIKAIQDGPRHDLRCIFCEDVAVVLIS